MEPPPYRIVTERLVVRCWEPRDAPIVKAAIDEFRASPLAAFALEAYDAAGNRVL